MDIDVRPCASTEELRDALNVISHYFGHENTDEDAERFANWIEVDRMHAARDDGDDRRRRGCVHLPHVGAGRRLRLGRRGHGRRRAADASPARRADGDDEGAARGLPRARRRGRVPVGVGGDDLRPVRLRPRVADRRRRRCRASARVSRSRSSRAARCGCSISTRRRSCSRRSTTQVVRAATRDVLAQQGVVGDAQAERRSRATPRRPAQPRAARARRQARRVRALPRRAGLDGRCHRAAR